MRKKLLICLCLSIAVVSLPQQIEPRSNRGEVLGGRLAGLRSDVLSSHRLLLLDLVILQPTADR